jgi:hypothetical protein
MSWRQSIVVALTIATVAGACKGDGKSPASGEKRDKTDETSKTAPPKADDKDITAPRTDWPERPLKRLEDRVDGIEISIELPAGLTREEKRGDDTFPGYVTWNATNFLTNPGFTVQRAPMAPANVEEAAGMAAIHPRPATVTTRENLPGGGFMVTMHENSKELIQVQVWKKSARTQDVVSLSIGLRHDGPIERFDAMKTWMEKVGRSFRVQ